MIVAFIILCSTIENLRKSGLAFTGSIEPVTEEVAASYESTIICILAITFPMRKAKHAL